MVIGLAFAWKAIVMHQNRRSAEELRRPLRVLRHCLQEIQQGRYSSSEIALKLHRIEPDTQLNTVIFELLQAVDNRPEEE